MESAPSRGEQVVNKPNKGKPKARVPESTYEEVRYLRHLIEDETPICVRLSTNEEIHGTVEYYDAAFIRLTRKGEPNLFVYKHDIKYLYEEPA
jgi:host factor-I protein